MQVLGVIGKHETSHPLVNSLGGQLDSIPVRALATQGECTWTVFSANDCTGGVIYRHTSKTSTCTKVPEDAGYMTVSIQDDRALWKYWHDANCTIMMEGGEYEDIIDSCTTSYFECDGQANYEYGCSGRSTCRMNASPPMEASPPMKNPPPQMDATSAVASHKYLWGFLVLLTALSALLMPLPK